MEACSIDLRPETTLEEVLKNNLAYVKFLYFLKQELSCENLICITFIEKYLYSCRFEFTPLCPLVQVIRTKDETIQQLSQILNMFIVPGAVKQVNISNVTRKRLQMSIEKYLQSSRNGMLTTTFHAQCCRHLLLARNEILSLLRNDSFARFIKYVWLNSEHGGKNLFSRDGPETSLYTVSGCKQSFSFTDAVYSPVSHLCIVSDVSDTIDTPSVSKIVRMPWEPNTPNMPNTPNTPTTPTTPITPTTLGTLDMKKVNSRDSFQTRESSPLGYTLKRQTCRRKLL